MKSELSKKYFRFIFPAIGGIWFYSIYSMVDGIFVGRGLGINALSAVNVAIPFTTFLFSISMLLSIGALNIISFSLGKANKEKADKYFTQTIVLSVIVSSIIALVSYFNMDFISELLGANEEVKDLVITYTKIIALFAPAMVVTYVFEMMIKADGKPSFGLLLMAISAFINIILDYLWVLVYDFGIAGAAWATGIAQLVPSVIYVFYFLSKKSRLKFRRFEIKLKNIKRTLLYGIPAFLAELSTGFIIFLFNNMLSDTLGLKGLAIFSVIMYMLNLFVNTILALNQGSQPLISFCAGKKDIPSIKKLRKLMLATVAIMSILAFVFIQIFAREIISVFIDTNKIDFLAQAVKSVRIFSIAFLFLGFNISIAGYMTAIQKPFIDFKINLLRGYIVVAIIIYFLPLIFGINSIWYVLIVSEILTLIYSAQKLKNIIS